MDKKPHCGAGEDKKENGGGNYFGEVGEYKSDIVGDGVNVFSFSLNVQNTRSHCDRLLDTGDFERMLVGDTACRYLLGTTWGTATRRTSI